MKNDLFQYRPELNEAVIDVGMSQMCSKPLTVVCILDRDIQAINERFRTTNSIIEDIEEEDEDDIENDNPFATDDDFEIVDNRGSIRNARDTFHNRTSTMTKDTSGNEQ